jgi:alpha-methylacyl-CoA racemase
MSVGALEPAFYAEFVRLLGLDEDVAGQYDTTRWPQLRQRIAERFASRTSADWSAVFDGSDACVAPVLSLTEAAAHPHLRARRTFVDVDGAVQPARAPRFSSAPDWTPAPPPSPGEHTRAVLREAGVTGIDELIAEGVAVEYPMPSGASQRGTYAEGHQDRSAHPVDGEPRPGGGEPAASTPDDV